MRNEIKVEALKDRDRTFDFGKFRAETERRPVVVVDGRKGAIMQFNAQGDFSEVQSAPMKTTMGKMLFESFKQQWPIHPRVPGRRRQSLMTTLGLLKAYEERGGRI